MIESTYEPVNQLKYPGVQLVTVGSEEALPGVLDYMSFNDGDKKSKKTSNEPKIQLPTFEEGKIHYNTMSPSYKFAAEQIENPAEAHRHFIKAWEGGYAEVKNDKGGPTNMGITLGTWKAYGYDKDGDGKITKADVKKLTDEDHTMVYYKFRDAVNADQIKDPNIANLVVDWVWGSGPYGIKRIRKALGVSVTKTNQFKVDKELLDRLNSADTRTTFSILKEARNQHFRDIVARDPSQKKFLKGWLKRNNHINWNSLTDASNNEYFK